MKTTEEHFDQVRTFWQSFYKDKTLSEEDAREMIETVGAVFDLLNQWDLETRGMKEPKNHVEMARLACTQ